MQMAIAEGRGTRPELEVGICGEHGGDPDSIEWCHLIGNHYVSCSPFRVPIARLAAAHAALKFGPRKTGKKTLKKSAKTVKPTRTTKVKPGKPVKGKKKR
jgi:pyruvate,orthophosphate dikinase